LSSGELEAAWCDLKGWYSTVNNCLPKPYFETMAKKTWEREELYVVRPMNKEHFKIKDRKPEDSEIREV